MTEKKKLRIGIIGTGGIAGAHLPNYRKFPDLAEVVAGADIVPGRAKAFFESYGMHDATWRSKSQFGTDRYTYDGSHGCVNMPYDAARYLYKNADKGTPVIVFRATISAAEEAAAKAEAEAAFAEDSKASISIFCPPRW